MFSKLAYLPSKLRFSGKYLFQEHKISVGQLSADSSSTETLFGAIRYSGFPDTQIPLIANETTSVTSGKIEQCRTSSEIRLFRQVELQSVETCAEYYSETRLVREIDLLPKKTIVRNPTNSVNRTSSVTFGNL